MEIYYYPRKGHIKRHYEELTKHVETMKNLESHETLLIHHEEYFSSDKEVIKVEECNKMMKTPFSTKGAQWHKDDTNCKRNEVIYIYI